MTVAKNLGKYIKERGFNLSEIVRQTGLNYQAVYTSLYGGNRERDLRSEELVALCILLDVDPRIFSDGFKRGR